LSVADNQQVISSPTDIFIGWVFSLFVQGIKMLADNIRYYRDGRLQVRNSIHDGWVFVPNMPAPDPDPNPDPPVLDLTVYVEKIEGLSKGDTIDLERSDIANIGDLLTCTKKEIFSLVGQNGLDAINAYLAARGVSLKENGNTKTFPSA
jgi:hypothetical protein